MSRPLPSCAMCGESLSRARSRVLITAQRPGSPMFGWHVAERPGDPGCSTEDLVAQVHFRNRNVAATLMAILKRNDPKRISAGKRFWDDLRDAAAEGGAA